MPLPLSRSISRLIILCLLSGAWLPAQATLLDAAATLPQAAAARTQLHALLDRAEVQQQLRRLGVSPQDAQARVDAMTNAEARQAAGRLATLPAGGDVAGIVIGAALILLITDLLGFTHIYGIAP